MSYEPGTRMLALSHSKNGTAFVFGEGEYLGWKTTSEVDGVRLPCGAMGVALRGSGRANPCIKLDNGQHVWGCECWWGPVDAMKEKIGDREIVIVDLPGREVSV